jgi:hypothetical protein
MWLTGAWPDVIGELAERTRCSIRGYKATMRADRQRTRRAAER